MISKAKITVKVELSCHICPEGEYVYEIPLAKTPLRGYLLSLLDKAKFSATRAGWDIPDVHEWICPSCNKELGEMKERAKSHVDV